MKIAVFFPGIGYHCDKPLLYYSRKLAQECGYEEIVTLSYTYDGGNIRGNEEKMQQAFEVLYAQAEESLSEIDFSQYDEILFVSKSVGTIIASAYAQKYNIKCRQILYTPLKYTYDYEHENTVAFIGTSDPWSVISEVQKLSEEQQVPIYTYENANHSLETKDTLENLEILQDVMIKTKEEL
ncbi:MAG: alpha/beta hydrolase [Ruminococcus sp.]|nr:alpha/beta hydrolase [Ruminococcus sp.]